ncbi:MAG: isochorismatase family protein, partial [Verrucomicrobiia bacterium]
MPTNQKDRSDLINTVALLVLDAQDCFIDTLHDKPGFLSRCTFAIDAAQALGITTLFTEQVPNKLGHTNAKLLRRAQSPKLFHKESFSALSAPGIESFLRDNEIYHLLVCGLETPICVYQTGLQAVDEDIDVTFLVDALGCRRAEDA